MTLTGPGGVQVDPGITQPYTHEFAAFLDWKEPVRVLEAQGVDAESELPFAGVSQLIGPMLGRVERLPAQRKLLRSLWALDILIEEGHAYDASIFPIRHDRYGIHDFPRFPRPVRGSNGSALQEFPISTVRLAGMNLPFVGGGYLRHFPVDILKIDRSFIRGMSDNPEGRILVQAILDLARALKLDTVAEGIELKEQRTELLTSGCASGQGFFFAEPVAPEQIEGLLGGVELPGDEAARAQRAS